MFRSLDHLQGARIVIYLFILQIILMFLKALHI